MAGDLKKLPCGRPQGNSKKEAASSELLSELKAQLASYVSGQRLNKSDAREKILETIVTEARHFRPLDLVDRLRKRHPEIGRATLYRNLPILVEAGVLQEGPTDPSGQCFYELTDSKHHDHLVCLDCGKIFEFNDSVIERRQDALADEMKFVPESHRHVIYARCGYRGK